MSNNRCECETYGECTTCRRPINYDSHRCVWCLEWFSTKNMFTVGNWKDNRKVCGPDCPKRPDPEEGHEVGTKFRVFNVRTVTYQSVVATDFNHARRKACAIIRDGVNGIEIISSKAKKKGSSRGK